MTDLQKLALAHIKEMAEELDSDAISLGITIGVKKEEFDATKHSYPIAAKSREIARWVGAILNDGK